MPGLQRPQLNEDRRSYLLRHGVKSRKKIGQKLGWDITEGTFLKLFHSGLVRACRRCVVPAEVRDEIEDEVLVFVLSEMKRMADKQVTRTGFDITRIQPSTFIFKSTMYGVMKFLREYKVDKKAQRNADKRRWFYFEEEPIEWPELRSRITDIMRAIGCTEAEIIAIRLRYFSGPDVRTYREIGEDLGISPQAVNLRIDKALRKLQQKGQPLIQSTVKEVNHA